VNLRLFITLLIVFSILPTAFAGVVQVPVQVNVTNASILVMVDGQIVISSGLSSSYVETSMGVVYPDNLTFVPVYNATPFNFSCPSPEINLSCPQPTNTLVNFSQNITQIYQFDFENLSRILCNGSINVTHAYNSTLQTAAPVSCPSYACNCNNDDLAKKSDVVDACGSLSTLLNDRLPLVVPDPASPAENKVVEKTPAKSSASDWVYDNIFLVGILVIAAILLYVNRDRVMKLFGRPPKGGEGRPTSRASIDERRL